MESVKCKQTYLWELDEDFTVTSKKNGGGELGINLLETFDELKQGFDDDSTDSESDNFNCGPLNVLLDPECGYACEKNIGWFDIALSKAPWDELGRPYEQVLKYEDVHLTEVDKEGTLTGMIVSTGINIFDAVPASDGHALTKLQLSDKGLKNIGILDRYKYLQYLDVSYNSIEDLSPLQHSMYLIVLDASNNVISQFNPDPTPWFLTYLNLSHNKFQFVPNVSSIWSLKHLNLSNNQIELVDAIENLHYLEYLNLSHNQIRVFGNIRNVRLVTLDLSWNRISRCADSPESLKYLNLSHNQIESMDQLGCVNPINLRHLNVAYNKFDSVASFDDLKRFKALRYLRLEGNRLIHELPELVKNIMHLLPQLGYINGNKLTKSERLVAYSMWKSDGVIDEMKKYCYDLLYTNVEPPSYGLETPNHLDYRVPIVILVGPCGSRKHKLADFIADKYPGFVRVPSFHTTMHPCANLEDVSEEFKAMKLRSLDETEFNRMWNAGKFVFVHSDLGDLFGLSREEMADDGKVLLLALNIGSALSLIWQGFVSSLVLIRPANEEEYSDLLQRYVASTLSVHKERDAVRYIEAMKDLPKESAAEDDKTSNQPTEDSSVFVKRKSKIPSEDRSLRSFTKKSSVDLSLRSVKSISTVRSQNKVDVVGTLSDFSSVEYNFDSDYPPWCDDVEEEDIPEGEAFEKIELPFIDTLKTSQNEKDNLWKLYDVYFDETKTYYDESRQHCFARTVRVDDLESAMEQILPLLVDKYNASLQVPVTKTEKGVLYDELVKPRLQQIMTILADRGAVDCVFEDDPNGPDAKVDAVSSSSGRFTRDSLSMPFFTASTSSLYVTSSSELTEFGPEEKYFEQPSDPWCQKSKEFLSTPSSADLEVSARESWMRAGFDVYGRDGIIKYQQNTSASNNQPF